MQYVLPNKTISVLDDVVPVIESLDVAFSKWVTEQLRRHAAASEVPFADQDAIAIGERMERSAPW